MSQIVIKPPLTPNYNEIEETIIFLAGSIEMGEAEDWQTRITEDLALTGIPHTILNPRRDDWDSSWEQSISNPDFKAQVNWEMDGIDNSDIVAVYFDPKTKSPITLLEIGSVIDNGKEVVICCPDGYWRKGNVEVVADRNGFVLIESYEEFRDIMVSKLVESYAEE